MKPFLLIFCAPLFWANAATGQVSAVTYSPSEAIYLNPERGFYEHREVQAEGASLQLDDLHAVRDRGRSLILRLYYLKSFRDKDLSRKQLDLIREDFRVMRAAGVKCILRFAYSQAIGQPDAPLAIVLRHLEQLRPLLQANADIIAVMQAGFIGAWGEWHSSTNDLDNTEARRAILTKILDVLPATRMVQVRTPLFKQQIFSSSRPLTPEQAFDESDFARIGHHNDCFLAGWNDFGTYQDTLSEKNYLSRDTRFVPMGGETCNPSDYSGCENALNEMARLRWSYMNGNYHPGVLEGFIRDGCMPEIERRLGYRFVLLDGEAGREVKPGSAFRLAFRVTNAGWASPYNPRPVEIILRNVADSSEYLVRLPDDPRFWSAGDTVALAHDIGVPASMPEGAYRVFLSLPDPAPELYLRPEYAIRTANDALWEPQTGYNDLLLTVQVEKSAPGEPYSGNVLLRPKDRTTSVARSRKDPTGIPALYGNYPNPFNPSTTIRYRLLQTEQVLLQVFDMRGRLLKTLMRGPQSPGEYRIVFDGRGLASGVYLYRLQTPTFRETRRMVLLR